MTKELKYMNIEYNDCDKEYIDGLSNDLEITSEKIVNFFNLDNYGEKINIKLFDNLNNFRNYISNLRKKETEEWLCGLCTSIGIYVLSLGELKKIKYHKDEQYDDYVKLITHEFVHSIQNKKYDGFSCLKWISDGMACFLANQYSNDTINCSFEDLIEGKTNYSNYKLLFEYIYNKYGMDYIEELIKDKEYAYGETKKLFDEVVNVRKNR